MTGKCGTQSFKKKTKLVESDKSNHIFFDTTNAHVCNRVKQEDFEPIAKKNSCNLEYIYNSLL